MTNDQQRPRRRLMPYAVLALVFAVGVIAAGCGSDDGGDSTDGTASADTEERTIGYSLPVGQEPQLQAIGLGMEGAVEQLGLPWEIDISDAKLSADQQVADLDQFVTQDLGGIASWTLDPGAADAAYQRARDADIPVVGINSESEFFVSRIQTETDWNGCVVSQEQVDYIGERVDNPKILVLGGPPVPSIMKFTECFVDEAEAAGYEIVDRGDDVESTGTSGQKLAQDLLAKNPDVNVIWAFGDTTAIGASAALRSDDQAIYTDESPKGVLLISRNGAPEAAAAIESGEMTASWDSNQIRSGAAAVQLLARHYVDGVPLDELPEVVDIPATLWDSANVAEYVPPTEREVELVDIG